MRTSAVRGKILKYELEKNSLGFSSSELQNLKSSQLELQAILNRNKGRPVSKIDRLNPEHLLPHLYVHSGLYKLFPESELFALKKPHEELLMAHAVIGALEVGWRKNLEEVLKQSEEKMNELRKKKVVPIEELRAIVSAKAQAERLLQKSLFEHKSLKPIHKLWMKKHARNAR